MINNHFEDAEQQALFDWASMKRIVINDQTAFLSDYLFAIPNGGKRNAREAGRMKKQGVKAGVSDTFLPIPIGEYHGLWIELKKPRKCFKCNSERERAVTEHQRKWIELMRKQNYRAEVCYGWLEAKDEIENYLNQEEK